MTRHALLVSLACLLLSRLAIAQPASFVDNVLILPKATVDETAYALELGLSFDGTHYNFGLLAAAEIPFTDTQGASVFDGQKLSVPSVEVGGADYSLELALLSADPIVFRLTSFAELADPTPTSLEQATALFAQSIETPIVQGKCTLCHLPGLIGQPSGLVFTQSGAGSQAANIQAFSNYLDGRADRRTRILSMVTGVGHSGGELMDAGDDEHTKLAEFLQLLLDHAAGS